MFKLKYHSHSIRMHRPIGFTSRYVYTEDLFRFYNDWVRDILHINFRLLLGMYMIVMQTLCTHCTSLCDVCLRVSSSNATHDWFPVISEESWQATHAGQEMLTLHYRMCLWNICLQINYFSFFDWMSTTSMSRTYLRDSYFNYDAKNIRSAKMSPRQTKVRFWHKTPVTTHCCRALTVAGHGGWSPQ